MKRVIYSFFVLVLLASCKKSYSDLSAAAGKDTTSITTHIGTTTGTGTTGGTGTTTGTGTGLPAITNTGGINFNTANQTVTIGVNQNTLNMIYNENVTFLIQDTFMTQSYAVHLIEDFSSSTLHNFDYTSYTREGVDAFDWVDDNLNNIDKTQKDTTVNSVAFTKITVARTFTFSYTYGNSEAAQSEYAALLNKQETIGFTIYLAPQYTGSLSLTTKATLIYLPAK